MRAMLDELMGKERNVPLGERKGTDLRFNDPEVCKYALSGLCPYGLFKNTKSDLGKYEMSGLELQCTGLGVLEVCFASNAALYECVAGFAAKIHLLAEVNERCFLLLLPTPVFVAVHCCVNWAAWCKLLFWS